MMLRLNPLLATLLVLVATLFLFEQTGLDLLVQDQLFLVERQCWIIEQGESMGRYLFYIGPKLLVGLLGFACFVFWILGFRSTRWQQWRRQWLFLFLAIALIPLTVSVGKHFSNTYCPYELVRYGKEKPYLQLFERYTVANRPSHPARCFPAGHASGGFALMAAYFVLPPASRRWGLAMGLAAGWILGIYQMLKGAHFLSHTVVTMILAWMILLLLQRWIRPEPF